MRLDPVQTQLVSGNKSLGKSLVLVGKEGIHAIGSWHDWILALIVRVESFPRSLAMFISYGCFTYQGPVRWRCVVTNLSFGSFSQSDPFYKGKRSGRSAKLMSKVVRFHIIPVNPRATSRRWETLNQDNRSPKLNTLGTKHTTIPYSSPSWIHWNSFYTKHIKSSWMNKLWHPPQHLKFEACLVRKEIPKTGLVSGNSFDIYRYHTTFSF